MPNPSPHTPSFSKKRRSPQGLLSEEFSLKNPPKTAGAVKKWLEDYQATNYPGRPITQQYLDMLELARKFKIKMP